MNKYWTILELEPTDDKTVIKRAYSQKLKVYHPEDDPEGFQRLREAYDYAMKQANKQGQSGRASDRYNGAKDDDEDENEDDEDEDEDDDRREKSVPRMSIWEHYTHVNETGAEDIDSNILHPKGYHEFSQPFDNGEEDDKPDFDEQLADFEKQLENLYEDFPLRINPVKWLELLNSDLLWNIKYKRSMTNTVLEFLEENLLLPRAVWDAIESVFGWNGLNVEEREQFNEEYPNVYAYIFNKFGAQNFDYYILLRKDNLDYDAYLLARLAAYEGLLDDDLQTAGNMLNRAYSLFKGDPDLLRLLVNYFNRLHDEERVLTFYTELVSLVPDDRDVRLSRARLLLRKGDWSNALKDANHILVLSPYDADALFFTGQCFHKLGQLENAREMLERLLQVNPNDVDGILSMAELNKDIANQLRQSDGDRTALKRVERELGKLPWRERLLTTVLNFFKGNYFVLFILVILHVTIAISFVNQSGYSQIQYMIETYKRVEIRDVTTIEELNLLSPNDNAVRLKLTDTRYLAIREIIKSDKKGNEVLTYLPSKESEDLVTSSSGYLCIGKLGNSLILINANYEQAMEMFKNHTIEIEGNVLTLDNVELQTQMDKWSDYANNTSSYIKESSIASKYVLSKDGAKKPSLPKIPVWIRILELILLLFYVAIFKQIRKFWKLFLYI